jgi:hypothetical protein
MNPTAYTTLMSAAGASVVALSSFWTRGADIGRRLGTDLALAGSDAR